MPCFELRRRTVLRKKLIITLKIFLEKLKKIANFYLILGIINVKIEMQKSSLRRSYYYVR